MINKMISHVFFSLLRLFHGKTSGRCKRLASVIVSPLRGVLSNTLYASMPLSIAIHGFRRFDKTPRSGETMTEAKSLLWNVLCLLFVVNSMSSSAFAVTFDIYPKAGTALPTQVIEGGEVFAYYTIANHTSKSLMQNSVKYLPENVSQVTDSPTFPGETCAKRFDLAAGHSCTLQLKITGAVNSVDHNPKNHLFVCPNGQLHGCSGTRYPLSVAVLPLLNIRELIISPSNALSMHIQDTVSFSATAIFSNNTHYDVSSLVKWSSTKTDIVSMHQSTATAIHYGSAAVYASFAGKISSNVMISIAPPLVSIKLTPSISTILQSGHQQYTAMGTYADGTEQDITHLVTWHSSDHNVTEIDAHGQATAKASGSSYIFATYIDPALGTINSEGAYKTILTVNNPLVAIDILPTDATINLGQTLQVFAEGKFLDGTSDDITSSVTWVSDNDSIVSMLVGGSITSGIYAQSKQEGQAQIHAESGGITSAPITLTVINPIVDISIISPMPSSLKAVNTFTAYPFKAVASFYNSASADITSEVIWSTTDASIASIDPSGIVMVHQKGQIKIEATLLPGTYQSLVDKASISIAVDNPIKSIEIDPKAQSLHIGDTISLKVTAVYADNSIKDITLNPTLQWSTSSNSIGQLDSKSRTFSALNSGVVSISVLDPVSHLSATTNVAVASTLQSISLSVKNSVIGVGATSQLTAMGQFSGTPEPAPVDITSLVNWVIDDPNLIHINSMGNAIADGVGHVNIYATYAGVNSSSVPLDITQYVYIVNFGDNTLSICPRHPDGALDGPLHNDTCTSYQNSDINGPISIAINPNEKYIYIANYNTSSIAICHIQPVNGKVIKCTSSSGVLKNGKSSIMQPVGVTITPDGNYLFVSNFTQPGSIAICRLLGNGQKIESCQSPFTHPTIYYPQTVTISPDGHHLYVSNSSPYNTITHCMLSDYNDQLTVSRCSAFGGYLDGLSSFSGSEGLSFDWTGKHAYVANCINNAQQHCVSPANISVCTVRSDGLLNCPRSASHFDMSYDFLKNWEIGIHTSSNNSRGYVIGYIPNNGKSTISYCHVNVSSGGLSACSVAYDSTFNEPSGIVMSNNEHHEDTHEDRSDDDD